MKTANPKTYSQATVIFLNSESSMLYESGTHPYSNI